MKTQICLTGTNLLISLDHWEAFLSTGTLSDLICIGSQLVCIYASLTGPFTLTVPHSSHFELTIKH